MGKIQDLPILDRPREKAYRYGIETLSDQELLALIIGSGFQGSNAHDIANKLLSENSGFVGLCKCPSISLTKTKGIKKTKALIIAAIFEIHKRIALKENEIIEDKISSEYLYNKYKTECVFSEQEQLFIVILDSRKKIIHEQMLYKGTSNQLVFSYHDIWEQLRNHNGKSYYLIHNHPNGDETPSSVDIVFTKELFRESKRVGVPLIDHIIIGAKGYYSFQK